MAINFNSGDILVVKQTYVQLTLAATDPNVSAGIVGKNITRTTTLLGQFKHAPVEVLATGSVGGVTDDGFPITWSFIQIRPLNQSSPSFQSGAGIIIYWHDDTGINDALELSSAFVKDSQAIRCLNTSGVTIFKGAVVYTTGFDVTSNLPTVALASAASSTTLAAFGLAEEAMLDGSFGTVIIDGHFQGLDTSAFTINDIVHLSDTPGQISVTPGTGASIIGRAINIGLTNGAIAFRGIIPLGQGIGGGGPGPQGATGIQGSAGVTGLQGITGILGLQGTTGIQGLEGNTGIGIVGAQGVTGSMGLGTTGVQGIQGIQGDTGFGIQGITGLPGLTGLVGFTGFQGDTGIEGLTGPSLADSFVRDEFTGSVVNDQTAFALSTTPSDASFISMEINGVTYRSTTFFTVVGTALTWLDVFSLLSSDVVDIIYPVI